MKLLLLFLLFSCGKHTQPTYEDVDDSDGDLIANHKEEGIEQYIANKHSMEEIKGVLSFKTEAPLHKLIEINFSNKFDIKKVALDLLTKNKNDLNEEDYFNEWSRLRFEIKEDIPLPTNLIDLNFKFAVLGKAPESFWMSKANKKIRLQHWSAQLKQTIGVDDFKDVLDDKSYFFLSDGKMEIEASIKQKTYRVFYFDGEKGTVYYISKELPFEKLLSHFKIKDAQEGSPEALFKLAPDLDLKQWWIRDLGEDNKVVIFAPQAKVVESFRNRFLKQKWNLLRINGRAQAPVVIDAQEGSLVYLKIRGKQTLRTFKGVSKKKSHSSGGGGGPHGGAIKFSCTYYSRVIQKEIEVPVNMDIEASSIKLEGIVFSRTETDDNGQYWLLGLHAPSPRFEVSLIDKLAASFVVTGVYKVSCNGGETPIKVRPVQTNQEGKMELTIESLVEKL